MDLKKIFPLIVPANYYVKGVWNLPHRNFPNNNFILTWVIFNNPRAILYITKEDYEKLNMENQNWQQQAFENLRLSIADNENFFTQCKKSSYNNQLLFITFMNADGIGSTRILLDKELANAFPKGYYVAFPDRSCGLVISKDIIEKDLKEIRQLVKNIFKDAAVPMSDSLHESEEFNLPNDWLIPIDNKYSELLAKEILRL